MTKRVFFDKPINSYKIIEHTVVSAMLILTALTGIVNQFMLSMGIVAGLVVLLFLDKLFLGFPFVIFYNSFYGLVFGISVLRIYTMLILVYLIILIARNTPFSSKLLAPFFVYALFTFAVIMQQGISLGVTVIIDVICVMVVVNDLSEKEGAVRSFFKIYVFVCLISFLTGMICENTIGDKYQYTRFNATFEDPNYMGFFFTIAIFSIVTLRLFENKIIRYGVIIALYIMIAASLSVTAIIVNIFVWAVYIIFLTKRKIKSTIAVALVAIAFMLWFSYGLSNPETPIMGQFAARINEKLEELSIGNVNAVTTGRTDLSKNNFEYYMSLPIFNILFGGTSVNTRYIVPEIKVASHNEYIDLLLNVGIIGAAVMLVFFFGNLAGHIKTYRETKDRECLCLAVNKLVWMCYAFALTMFLDYRFMLIFLI